TTKLATSLYPLSLHDALPIYGPVLLAAPVSHENVGASYQAGVIVRMSTPQKDVVDSLIVEDAEVWKARIRENLVRVEDGAKPDRSEEHTSELQSRENLVCRLL